MLQDFDSAYEKAIKDGNKDLGEMLAMKQAESQGFLFRAYHGTFKSFKTFKPGDIGIHFAKDINIARNRLLDIEDTYSGETDIPLGKVIHVALKMNKPFNLNSDFQDWLPSTFFKCANYKVSSVPFESPSSMYLYEQKKMAADAYRFLKTIGYSKNDMVNLSKMFDSDSDIDKLNSDYTNEFRARLTSKGYDSIIYKNDYEAYEHEDPTCYIVLIPNQIKSIEPVYVDNLLITLSKRFNENSPFFEE